MISIKNKIAKMIALADGGLVCHRHAVEAGVFGADIKPNPGLKKQKQYPKNK